MIDLAPHNPYGLDLRSPVIAAAGALGYGVEYARLLDLGAHTPTHGLGALVTRTTTLYPQRARSLPGIIETPAGLLYHGAEHNPGVQKVIVRYAGAWARWGLPVIMSIGGVDATECADVAAALEGIEGVAGIELRLASLKAIHAESAARAVAAVRAATLLPLLVKLPPEAPDIADLARAVVAAGADALALIDGAPGMALDPQTGEQVRGRVSGPAVRPLALALTATVAAAVDAPVIGGGGIYDADDARQFLSAGASAVGVGAALLSDPHRAAVIAAELAASV